MYKRNNKSIGRIREQQQSKEMRRQKESRKREV